MAKLLPILLILLGIGAGAGAGFALRPAPEPEPVAMGEEAGEDVATDGDGEKKQAKPAKKDEKGELSIPAFVKLNNQFIVPVVKQDDVSALVVLSLTLETDEGSTDQLYNLEPKIRDTALRVLFNHAYAGGFDGHFTAPMKMDMLREALMEAVNVVASDTVTDVLITDIIRQDT
jgi:hypothetical protein